MKKIIKGRKYSTETAKQVGYMNNIDGRFIISRTDTDYHESALYQKKTGEFFLWGDSSQGKEYICPINEDEAKEWSEQNLSVEQYEEIFGEVEE